MFSIELSFLFFGKSFFGGLIFVIFGEMIDTITISKSLQESGMDEKHADAVALAIYRREEGLATKKDVVDLKADLRREFVDLRKDFVGFKGDFRAELSDFKKSIGKDVSVNRWLVGLSLALHGITIAGVVAIVAILLGG